MTQIDVQKLQLAVRSLSVSLRSQMKGRGGYRVRPGDGDYLGKITVGLGELTDQVFFPLEYEGFTLVFLPLEKVV